MYDIDIYIYIYTCIQYQYITSHYMYLVFLSNSRLRQEISSFLPGNELPHDLATKTLQALAQVASCLPAPSLGINGSTKTDLQFHSVM